MITTSNRAIGLATNQRSTLKCGSCLEQHKDIPHESLNLSSAFGTEYRRF
jgi:hypothetical protein